MSMQKELFPESKIDISPDINDMAKIKPSLCYDELRKKGMTIGLSLWFILKQNLETDFSILWNEYESKGLMTYVDVYIHSKRFRIIEFDSMELEFNDKIIFEWDNEMTFDNESIQKIKVAIKNHCVNNQFQFDLK